jgi:NDP-sugar pyrophosphorylase family protein
MNAMIFAAGLGTRLRPLTNTIPKAMVLLDGKPLLEHVILRLKEVGVKRIVVNVHHFAEKVISFIENGEFGLEILISHEKEILLDTGGGLKNAKHLFLKDEPILIYNVDILSDFNLLDLISSHKSSGAIATLLARSSFSDRVFMQKNGNLTGWQNLITGEKKIVNDDFHESTPIGFTGIQILSYDILSKIEEEGVFSIVDMYLRLAKTNKISVLIDDESLWMDLGTPEALAIAEREFQS